MTEVIASINDLPRPGPVRWVPRRKEAVVVALIEEVVSEREVFERYPDLSPEELASWKQRYGCLGRHGLRSIRVIHTPVP